MGRSAVFPYPAVQYIPIHFSKVQILEPNSDRPLIIATDDLSPFKNRLERDYGILLENQEITEDEAFIIIIGIKIIDVRYRGFYVTMLGQKSPGGFLARIPTRYFYKKPVIFQARCEDGTLIAGCQYPLTYLKSIP